MINTMLSICKYLQDGLSGPPYGFTGEIKVGFANQIDREAELPKILVNDVFWTWEPIQYGQFPSKRLDPLEIQVFGSDKLSALEMVSWIVGKELLGAPEEPDELGILLKIEIPLWRFADDKKTIIGPPGHTGAPPPPIGKIVFGDDPLPEVRFSESVETAEMAYNYVISYGDVVSMPEF